MTIQASSPVASLSTTTFTVVFVPNGAGTRTATLIISNDDPTENIYNFDIKGNGRDSFFANFR